MKVGIFSHCTMDTIVYENKQYEAPGGPASYCSLTARKQKHDVNLYTKFGPNYPLEEFFKENKIIIPDSLSPKIPTCIDRLFCYAQYMLDLFKLQNIIKIRAIIF